MFQPRFYYDGWREDRALSGFIDKSSDIAINDKAYLALTVGSAGCGSLKITWKNAEYTYTIDSAIGGSPWRTWCCKTAVPVGDWRVKVGDSKGNLLKEMSFKVK